VCCDVETADAVKKALKPFLVLFVTAICGCADAPSARALCSVSGQVLISGQPAANASIAFHPDADSVARNALPVAKTDAGGKFQLTTWSANDGAPPGDYDVTVVWIDASQVDECQCEDLIKHDRLRGRYADPETTWLHATVRPGVQNELLLVAERPLD
jgi:hypothetical protein